MDDLRINRARVIDPAGSIDTVCDIAVSDGKIRAVGELEPGPALVEVDGSGLIATPGLVDMHTHIHSGAGFWGLDPDPIAWHTGVTTWVDAGSVGAFGLQGLLTARRDFRVRSAILLHIAAHGLSARTGESRDLAFLDEDAALRAITQNRDAVRGIKVRMDTPSVGESGLAPLEAALRVGEAAGVPVMVHIGRGSFTLDEVVDRLGPGDIITHCSGNGARDITNPGPIRDALAAAYQRGVLFDIGHGAGGFNFDVLDAYLGLDMPPQVISSDLHVLCANGPAFDLPSVMASLLAGGMELADVIAAATTTPATALGLPAGTLAPGAAADIALFRPADEPVMLADVHGTTRPGALRLINTATYVAGRELPPAFPQAPPPWVPMSEAQRAALDRRERMLRDMLNTPLVGPADVYNQIPKSTSTGKG